MKISRAYIVTFTMVALALFAAIILYGRYSTRPWTRDAQVRAKVGALMDAPSGFIPLENVGGSD